MVLDLTGASKPPQDQTSHTCFLCRSSFSSRDALTVHYKAMHVDKGTFNQDFPCPECRRSGKPDHLIKRWLDHPKNTRWLMIYDNYDNPKLLSNTDHIAIDIRRFLPEAYHGSIIVTTRSSQVSIGHRIRLGKLKDVRDSLQILSNTSRWEGVIDGELSLMLVGIELTLQIPMPRSLLKSLTDFRWPWPRPALISTRCQRVLLTTCVCTRHHG